MNRKIRVGVNGHDLKFWLPLQRSLEATGLYEFRHDEWSGHETHDDDASKALIEWADLIVSEWALANAVYYAKHKRPNQKHFVRLHAQERRTTYPERIDYESVDAVVFVGQHILEECVAKFGIPRSKCVVIGNFVDVKKFQLPKFGGTDFVLGMIGTAPSSKRLDLALDTLERLLTKDDRYCLRVKGANPASIDWLWARTAERKYYEDVYERINCGPLRHKVIFDPRGNDVHHWLKMVGTILSPSDHESFHMAVAEGAASGALPIVWAWPSAEVVYPEFPLVHSAEEAAEAIDFHNRSRAGRRLREQAPQVIRLRYDADVISAMWLELLGGGAQPRGGEAGHLSGARSVLIIWAIDNWSTFHRREMIEALADHLADSCDVVVIEPGSHFETIERLGWASRDELSRMAAGELIREKANIYRIRLFAGTIPVDMKRSPIQGGSDVFKVLDGLIDRHYGSAAKVLHWVYKPDQALRLDAGRRFVYEVYDDYTMNFGTGEVYQSIVEAEPVALAKAEHVFFTSEPLRERKAGSTVSSSLVSNGVASEVFARYRVPRSGTGQPVAGYLGNLSVFFDWSLMLEVCEAMPEVDFVFHGQVELAADDPRRVLYARMREMNNVRFTGRVSRQLGAAAINRYDVLLIPFVVNDAMHAVNPLKLWEYFATGLPVVSTPIDAIQEGAPAVVMAEGAEAWVAAIRSVLVDGSNGSEAASDRIAKAEAHRWHALTERHAQVLRRLMGATEVIPGSVPNTRETTINEQADLVHGGKSAPVVALSHVNANGRNAPFEAVVQETMVESESHRR